MLIQIKDINDSVIFEYEKENNTVKDTVEKAVKQGVNLSYANLKGANLQGANLNSAYLYKASLNGANLSGAYLYYCNLINADLKGADLRFAYFSHANLSDANLVDANFMRSFLIGTCLCNADLRGADFRDACVSNADFKGANVKGANFNDVSLRFAGNIPDGIPMVCPERGSFIGWKKVFNYAEYLIKLEIPDDAKRSSATSKKCRCSKAKVLEIINVKTNENVEETFNLNFVGCLYRVGEMVYPDSFDENRWNECSHGIHFFMDKLDAIKY